MVHVIMAIYSRNNTGEFLSRLGRSMLPTPDAIFVFHICNNNHLRLPEMLALAQNYTTATHIFRVHAMVFHDFSVICSNHT